ncbi:MAG: M67 family metallopeptidase [Dehalococcoidia bacterium]
MLTIPRQCFDEIAAHSNQEYPNECCGILIGAGDEIREVLRGRNVLESPYKYQIHPLDVRKADDLARERDLDILAFYHSHTAIDATKVTEAYPSETDINHAKAIQNLFQGYYLIMTLKDRDAPELRAFRIIDGTVDEQELQIV